MGNRWKPEQRWTTEQDEALRKIWPTGERLKLNMHRFGDHSYAAVITRAYQLGLGKREKCFRGQSPIAWTLIQRVLKTGPADRFRVAELTSLDPATTHKQLRKANLDGIVHIGSWARRHGSGKMVPVYSLGKGIDAAKPPRQTDAEKGRRLRARNRQSKVVSGAITRGVNPFSTLMQQVSA